MKGDSKFRLKNVRTYLFDYVQIAWNAIYKLGAAIAGEAVNRLLKATSSVPTVVSQLEDPLIFPTTIHSSFMFPLECIY